MAISSIRCLNKSRSDWIIRANVYKVWNDAITNDFHFILSDSSHNRIAGTVPGELVGRFFEIKHREDFWLELANFIVEDAPRFGKNSSHNFQIRLSDESKIYWRRDMLPCQIFKFVGLEEIHNDFANHTSPIDIIGAVTSVGPLREWDYESRTLPHPWYSRFSVDFKIEDEKHNSIEAVAYASHAQELIAQWENKQNPWLICFLKCVNIINAAGFRSVDVDPNRSVIMFKSPHDHEAEEFANSFIFRDEGQPSSADEGSHSQSDQD